MQRDVVQVSLLIGANCMKAMEPSKIIHSEGGSQYAYKTRLGWCVTRPTVEVKGSLQGATVSSQCSS